MAVKKLLALPVVNAEHKDVLLGSAWPPISPRYEGGVNVLALVDYAPLLAFSELSCFNPLISFARWYVTVM